MSNRNLPLVLALASALVLPSAFAAQAEPGQAMHMGRDAQPVTLAEAYQRIDARATTLDANHDGTIDAAEFAAARDNERAKRLDARFDRIDANGDGVIDKVEFAAAHPAREDARQGRGMMREDAAPVSVKDFVATRKAHLAKLDSDGDGVISSEEFKAGRRGHGMRDGGGMQHRDGARHVHPGPASGH